MRDFVAAWHKVMNLDRFDRGCSSDHRSAPHAYTLTRSRVSSTGIMIGHYERDGEIKIGGTELDSPSDREIARQERMKREG